MPLLKSIKTLLGFVLLGIVGTWISCSDSAPVASRPAGKATCALCEFLGDETYTAADGVAAPESPDTTQTQAEADSTQADADADSTQTDVVEFADANLEAAVREALDRPSGPLTAADLATLTVLNANGRGIQSLAGLEHATALQELALRSNEITDVSPLASLTNLQALWLWGNDIEDVSPLASLTNLRKLSLWGNAITDVSPLASLTKLQWLQLGDNAIEDITPLASLTKLRWLSVVNNALSQHAAEQQLADLVASDLSVQAQVETIQTEDFVFPEPESEPPVVPVLYWVDFQTHKIQRANSDDKNVEEVINTGVNTPYDIALDVANRKMYYIELTTDATSANIQRADMDGVNSNVQDVITGLDTPGGIALDLANRKMYWTEFGTLKRIKRANMDGENSNIENVINTGLSLPGGIALDVANRKMYWTDRVDRKIQQADMDGVNSNVQDVITTGTTAPWRIALDLAKRKMYWTDFSRDRLLRANMDGVNSNVQDVVVITTETPTPDGIALDLANRKVYWTDRGRGQGFNTLLRADMDGVNSNIQDIVPTGLGRPAGIALHLVPR